MNRLQSLFLVCAWVFCGLAQAQWQWIDKDNKPVFSDRPPPADVPAAKIVKRPVGGATARPAVALPPSAPASGTARTSEGSNPEGASPQLSSVDKDLVDKKKQADAAAAAKIKAEQDQAARVKAENCERLSARKVVMDSGVRVSVANSKGEADVLDDAGRAAELRKIQALMASNCR